MLFAWWNFFGHVARYRRWGERGRACHLWRVTAPTLQEREKLWKKGKSSRYLLMRRMIVVTPKSFRLYVVHMCSMKDILSQLYLCIQLYCTHNYCKVYFLRYVLNFSLYIILFIVLCECHVLKRSCLKSCYVKFLCVNHITLFQL